MNAMASVEIFTPKKIVQTMQPIASTNETTFATRKWRT